MVRRTRAPLAGSTAFAVLTEQPDPIPDGFAADAAGSFLETVLDSLGDLGRFSVLEITDGGEPRLALHTSERRTYGLTLPGPSGPFEIWASVEMPLDDKVGRYQQLREREEVLAQALHTSRLAWHQSAASGWIGLPVALAGEASELDGELAVSAAEQVRMMVYTIERICRALDERAEARNRRRRERLRPVNQQAPAAARTPSVTPGTP